MAEKKHAREQISDHNRLVLLAFFTKILLTTGQLSWCKAMVLVRESPIISASTGPGFCNGVFPGRHRKRRASMFHRHGLAGLIIDR